MPRRPLEWLNLFAVSALLLIAVALAGTGRLSNPWPSFRLYGLLLLLTLLAAWVDRHPSWRPRWVWIVVAEFYPLVLVPQVFNSLQPLITALGLPNQDALLIAIDQTLLGGHDATLLLQRFVTPWLNDVMHLAYCTYYFFCLVVGLTMWFKSRDVSRRFIFTASLAFFISYIGYFLAPARGPRFAQAAYYTVSTHDSAISRAIYDTLNFLENTKDDVYPSGHVMITVVCLLAAWKFSRRLFAVLLPIALLLCTATVYCRYHYLIDVISGFTLALVVQPAGYLLYDRWARRLRLGESRIVGESTIVGESMLPATEAPVPDRTAGFRPVTGPGPG